MSKKFISVLRLATDLAIINISFILAAIFAQSWNTLLQRQYMFVLLLLSNILWFVTARATKLNSDLSSRSLTSEAIILFNNIFIQITVFIFFIFTIKEDLFTRNFILYFSAGSYFLILSKSVVLKQIIIKARQNGKNLRKVVIIGNNKTGIDFKNSIIDNSNYGYKFIGFIDSNNTSETIASINEFESFLNSEQVDEVIIALDVKEFDTIRKVLRICDRKAVKSFIIPDYFQLLSNKFQLDMFGNYPVIRVRNNPLEEFHWRFLKRTFDFFFALILFAAVFWWLFLIIGLVIKLTSKGPIFFIQDRVGKNNDIFRCYKFRTMTVEASSKSDFNIPVTNKDSRITSFGRLLRKSNLDEIPQIINVLKGEMSIVGPRPHAIPFDKNYGEIVDEIRLRHRVKPGITGWAQIHGLRGDVFYFDEQIKRTKKRIEYDIWYIENWSFKLDLQIIARTVYQILTGGNMGN